MQCGWLGAILRFVVTAVRSGGVFERIGVLIRGQFGIAAAIA
ncbi:hypothetical protein O982_24010 [Mycobacterium avium 10-5581]|nr:hypothetical protein O982_24010 [Mycobacterium avium 10-5581]